MEDGASAQGDDADPSADDAEPAAGDVDDATAELRRRKEEAHLGGGEERIEAQHEKGKLTARERIEYLLDDDTFEEIDTFVEHECTNFDVDEQRYAGDAVVTGYGDVYGRKIFVFAHDFTVLGGSVSKVVGDKVCKVMDLAIETGVPVVGLNDSGGARIQEGVDSLAAFSRIFRRNMKASGLIPQISCIMGPCAGGATYSPALTDFTFMVEETSHMMITGPDVIETVTGEQVTKEELGGANTHASTSGVAHVSCGSEEEALDGIRRLLSYLPSNHLEDPPTVRPNDQRRTVEGIGDIVPEAPKHPYDVVEVVDQLVDEGSFFEIHSQYARNVVVGYARIDGQSVGIVANQPRINAGTLDIEASQKASRFVRSCDAFNVPIVTLVDVPGFMPGTDQEHNGIIKHGSKLIYAYAEATVPLLTVVLRKAYGGAYIVMGSKNLGADVNYAWPGAEMAVMGPRGAVNIVYREELAAADDTEARRQELIDEYREQFANPYKPAQRGHIDDIIEPKDTRARLINDLELLSRKQAENPPKDHGNIQL